MRILYLDDSGKVDVSHDSTIAVIAGFSIAVTEWHRFQRQVVGAKAKIRPERGNPNSWEIKNGDFLKTNPWLRAKNRKLCFELVEILKRTHCRVYAASVEKSKIQGDASAERFTTLMIQRLVKVFHDELTDSGQFGVVVCDWTTHGLDQHISNCIISMTIAKQLQRIVGGVTYGSSHSLVNLQTADIIASAFRREEEGQIHLTDFVNELKKLDYQTQHTTDSHGFSMKLSSVSKVF